MKDQNKQLLAKVINDVVTSESQELVKEKEALQTKLIDEQKKSKELGNKVTELERLSRSFAKYKAFYYTHFSICPECDWEWWFEHEFWGEECDMCNGQWEMKNEELQKYFKEQIDKEMQSKKVQEPNTTQDSEIPF